MALGQDSNTPGTGLSFPWVYMENRFVYLVLSARAGGMTIGVNGVPRDTTKASCVYDVNGVGRMVAPTIDVEAMAGELTRVLSMFRSGRVRDLPNFRLMPDQLLNLRHVALGAEDDPILAPQVPEALEAIIHVRASAGFSFFKLVVITAGIGLELPIVQRSLRLLTRSDEVWVSLEGGTQAYVNKINQTDSSLQMWLSNILLLARQRPVVIQSPFRAIDGEGPAVEEIEQYGQRLLELKKAGGEISRVQICSANGAVASLRVGLLPLKALSQIARRVREITGITVEVA